MLNQVFGLVLSITLINSAPVNVEEQKLNINSSSYDYAIYSENYKNYSSDRFYKEVSLEARESILQKREEERKRQEREKKEAEERRLQEEKAAAEKKRQEALLEEQRLAEARRRVIRPPAPIHSDFESEIRNQCSIFGCNSTQLIRVMYCESGGRADAYNPSGATGLFQFMPPTFAAYAPKAGISNPDIWNPYQQIRTAAWMFANGQAHQWVCK